MTVRDELSRVQSQLTAQNSEFTALSQNILSARETIASLTAKHQEADKARRDQLLRCTPMAADDGCAAKAVDKNGKPLAGAAKSSFVKKCQADGAAAK